MKLYEKPGQRLEYAELTEEAVVGLMRTHAVVMADFDRFVQQFGLTAGQYNVLRILRGAHRAGEQLSTSDIRFRLVERVSPDVSRMLSRLEKAGLLRREHAALSGGLREAAVHITAQGLSLLDDIGQSLTERNRYSMSELSDSEQRQLIDLLARVRGGVYALPPLQVAQTRATADGTPPE